MLEARSEVVWARIEYRSDQMDCAESQGSGDRVCDVDRCIFLDDSDSFGTKFPRRMTLTPMNVLLCDVHTVPVLNFIPCLEYSTTRKQVTKLLLILWSL